jgi:hypothetical protein
LQFVIGDFMLFVEEKYGEAAFQLFGAEDWERGRNWRWICRSFPLDQRRTERHVVYDHYRMMVTLKPEQKTYLLSRVARERLTTRNAELLVRDTVIEEKVEDVEDRNFWKMWAAKVHAGATTLREAIDEGKEVAEKRLDAKTVKSFDEWIVEYEADTRTAKKSIRTQLRDAWYAARKNMEASNGIR